MAPLLSALVTGALLGALLHYRGVPLDRPNERSLHTRAVPRIGGMAAVPAIAVGWGLLPAVIPLSVWASLAILFAVSLLDDFHGLPVGARLLSHLGAAGTVAATMVLPDAGWFAALAAALTIAWMTNLYNFMDGSDGLAGGMTLFGFAGYAIAAWLADAPAFSLACAAISAASAAFLCFNFHPARVFLGDAGSIPVGFLAAALGAQGWIEGLWPAWYPILVFSPFVVDATITLLRRAARRERLWQAHRQHYYQRLVRLGWGHRRTAMAEYALMLACVALGLFGIQQPPTSQAIVLAACAGMYAVLLLWVDRAWRHRPGQT